MDALLPLSAAVSLSLLAAPARAQTTSVRVRLAPDVAARQADRLRALGFEILGDEHGSGSDDFEMILTPADQRLFEPLGVPYEVLEVGRPLHEIQAERSEGQEMVPSGYPDLATVVADMTAAAAAFPSICRLVDLTATYGQPTTFEGRSLFAVVISDNVNVQEDEPAFLMVSCHHSREIVTPVIALDAIDRLTTLYGVDPAVTQAVDQNEIWIAPVWNPDGYEYVFNVDNLWRKNRRPVGAGIGIDLNRNYPSGWTTACSGSTNPTSNTYKGPAPGSEAETSTMLALMADRHFAKVLDYHSSGRETLWGYACPPHPFDSFLQAEATALSAASGYGGQERPPSADGEHYEAELATMAAHAFLTETHVEFQPAFASASAEAALVWPGTQWLLARAIPLWGHVVDGFSGAPLVASISLPGLVFQNGESNQSFGPFARYHAFLPAGSHTLRFSAPGYLDATLAATTTAAGSIQADVALAPVPVVYCTPKASSQGCLAQVSTSGTPSLGGTSPFTVLAVGVPAQKSGLLFYGYAPAALPFQGGTLCVQPPLARTTIQNSGPGGTCTGFFTFDLVAWAQSGVDPLLAPGNDWYAQFWGRDPAAPVDPIFLSDAVHVFPIP